MQKIIFFSVFLFICCVGGAAQAGFPIIHFEIDSTQSYVKEDFSRDYVLLDDITGLPVNQTGDSREIPLSGSFDFWVLGESGKESWLLANQDFSTAEPLVKFNSFGIRAKYVLAEGDDVLGSMNNCVFLYTLCSGAIYGHSANFSGTFDGKTLDITGGEHSWFSDLEHADYKIVANVVSPVPEPMTMMLLGGGLIGAVVRRRKR